MNRKVSKICMLVLVLGVAAIAIAQARPATAFDGLVDRVTAQEAANMKTLRQYTPIVETYIQDMKPNNELGEVPAGDHYFLGRVSFQKRLEDQSFVTHRGFTKRWLHRVTDVARNRYLPDGFAQMAIIDSSGFNRQNYNFHYVGREFLGSLRCVVIDVSPKKHVHGSRFLGRIWVEDQDDNIVRFNGTYVPQAANGSYVHFDTWRLNMAPGVWLPAYVYSEELGKESKLDRTFRFKAQTRFWGYDVGTAARESEFTQVLVDTNDTVKDQSKSTEDLSPVASQREWDRQAEDNVLERLQTAGLLAKSGDVDKVLATVVNNLEITNNLNIEPPVRARVLLTTPIESFAIGHTIVLSRGLLDVLPDEASLAAVLARELANITLGHNVNTSYAFSDRMQFPDYQAFNRLHFGDNPVQEEAAEKRAVEYLKNSPYKDKLVDVGLFLRQLQNRQKDLPNLIRAHLGNTLTLRDNGAELTSLMNSAPKLDPKNLNQIAALPLGGRIKVDPWNDSVEMLKNKPVALISPNEKMPFEVTPFFPYLTRLNETTVNDAEAPQQTPAAAPVNNKNRTPVNGSAKVAVNDGSSNQ